MIILFSGKAWKGEVLYSQVLLEWGVASVTVMLPPYKPFPFPQERYDLSPYRVYTVLQYGVTCF